jgi:hypothetical protein
VSLSHGVQLLVWNGATLSGQTVETGAAAEPITFTCVQSSEPQSFELVLRKRETVAALRAKIANVNSCDAALLLLRKETKGGANTVLDCTDKDTVGDLALQSGRRLHVEVCASAAEKTQHERASMASVTLQNHVGSTPVVGAGVSAGAGTAGAAGADNGSSKTLHDKNNNNGSSSSNNNAACVTTIESFPIQTELTVADIKGLVREVLGLEDILLSDIRLRAVRQLPSAGEDGASTVSWLLADETRTALSYQLVTGLTLCVERAPSVATLTAAAQEDCMTLEFVLDAASLSQLAPEKQAQLSASLARTSDSQRLCLKMSLPKSVRLSFV